MRIAFVAGALLAASACQTRDGGHLQGAKELGTGSVDGGVVAGDGSGATESVDGGVVADDSGSGTDPFPAQPTDVSYALPGGAAAVNMREAGAKGDGVTDDTAAILTAISKTYNAWEELYFPAGTYLLSGEISWQRFMTVRGDGPGKTILKLKDGAAGYADRANPKSVLFCRYNGKDPGNNNTSHSNHIMHLTVDVGANNPGAYGLDFSAHNGGGIEDVEVRAASTSGAIGIYMDRNGNGPALIDHVQVSGFDYGLSVGGGIYALTFEDIRLSRQRTAGMRSDAFNASIRGLVSNNSVPAITVSANRDYGLLVLLDSRLEGGSPATHAIESDGELFVRNVTSSGYKGVLRDGSSDLTASTVAEYSSSLLRGPGAAGQTSLNLSVPATPLVPWESDLSKWASADDYQNLRSGNDWSAAIQAAIDSGKRTLYFPNYTNTNYPILHDVHVRGSVQRILGLQATFGDAAKFIFDNTAPVVAEQVRMDGGIEIRGTGAVILRRSLGGTIKTFSGAGPLFIEDWCCGGLDIDHTTVWARQYNEESLRDPKITNNGGQLWVLGLKTEQLGQILANSNGAKSEILGGLIYPAQGTPTGPLYRNDHSSLTALHRELGAYPNFVLESGALLNPPFEHGTRYRAVP